MKARPQVDGISRAANGRFKLRIWLDGRLRKGTFPTRQEAEEARDRLRARLLAARLGLPVPVEAALPPTIGSVLDAYAAESEALGRSERHVQSIRQARALLVRWRGEHMEAGLHRADLVDFVAWCRRETRSRGRMIHNALVILRTALRRADLPVPAVPRLELPARTPKTLGRAELVRLLARLPVGTVIRTAIEIGLRTGAREAEIRRIRVGDLDLRRRTLVLRRAKGRPGRRGSEEVVPISPGLDRVLRAFVAKLPADVGPDAPLLGRPSFRRTLEAACMAADVPVRTTIGWTRAQAATMAREAGMPLGLVSGTLGHVDERTTRQHYDESSREVAERWTARLSAGRVLDRVLAGTKRVRPRPRSSHVYPKRTAGARSSGG